MGALEAVGLITGLLCVIFLIRQNVLTWLFGILYVLVSFYVFWTSQLYGDFILHVFYLVLNVYGWYAWVKRGPDNEPLKVSYQSMSSSLQTIVIVIIGIFLFAQLLIALPSLFPGMEPAALPYWDSITSTLSVAGMWLTTKKKIENWYYWLLVDIIATGVYYYKGLYFYSALYFIYIGFAVWGYIEWRRSYQSQI